MATDIGNGSVQNYNVLLNLTAIYELRNIHKITDKKKWHWDISHTQYNFEQLLGGPDCPGESSLSGVHLLGLLLGFFECLYLCNIQQFDRTHKKKLLLEHWKFWKQHKNRVILWVSLRTRNKQVIDMSCFILVTATWN